MMNLKITLKNLHKKFPNLTLDELFTIVDCYTEEIHIANPYKDYMKDNFKDWTVTCNYPKGSVADQISKLNGGITYDADSRYASGTSDHWIEGKH
jgi:hypothetical protein